MLVPFLELKRESERCRAEIEQTIARVLKSGRYILGPELEALETEFARYLKVPFAVGVASGTDALTRARGRGDHSARQKRRGYYLCSVSGFQRPGDLPGRGRSSFCGC